MDGDRALVVAEPVILKAAERECADVVPLYYPMAKAPAHEVTPDAMYEGMVAAWTGGNIGAISNTISKIWAMDTPDVGAVKVLVMENNFVIDYAKTLYKCTRPEEWNNRLKKIESAKLPAFFYYAKDKTLDQVKPRGNGVIDRLCNHVRNYKFRWSNKTIPPFDYKMLMYNKNRPYGEAEEAIVQEFRNSASGLQFVRTNSYAEEDNHNYYEIKRLMKHMEQFGRAQDVCDILVRGLFHEHVVAHKAAFWLCYGDIVYDNLVANLQEQKKKDDSPVEDLVWKECSECGNGFKANQFDIETVCPACRAFGQTGMIRRCIDCGAELPTKTGVGRGSVRCDSCQRAADRAVRARAMRELRKRRA